MSEFQNMYKTEDDRVIYNGTYTLSHAKGHFTVRIKTQPKDASFAPGSRVIALMRGTDNECEGSYKPFGFVRDGRIILWNRYREDATFKRLAHLMTLAITRFEDRDEVALEDRGRLYTVQVSKVCCVCNRKLTNPESIRAGIGPECLASRMAA